MLLWASKVGDVDGEADEQPGHAMGQTGPSSKPPEWWASKSAFWEEQKKRGFGVDMKHQNGLSGLWKRAISADWWGTNSLV